MNSLLMKFKNNFCTLKTVWSLLSFGEKKMLFANNQYIKVITTKHHNNSSEHENIYFQKISFFFSILKERSKSINWYKLNYLDNFRKVYFHKGGKQ